MHCDIPPGFYEDCTYPPCEIFLQLFIENPDVDDDIDIGLPDDDSPPPLFNLHPMVDGFDNDDDFPGDYNLDDASSLNSDFSVHIVSANSDISTELSDSDAEAPEIVSGDEPQYEVLHECVIIPDTANEVSVCEAESQEDLSIEQLRCKEVSSRSGEETSSDIWLLDENSPVVDFPEEDADVYFEPHCSLLTSPSPDNFDEESSIVPYEGVDNSDSVPTLLKGLSDEGESSNSNESTYVSLLVVVPPTNISSEASDSLLPVHSSDNVLPELLPIDSPCSSQSFQSGNGNFESDDFHEISICAEDKEVSKSYACDATSANSDYQNLDNILVPQLTTVNSDYQASLSVSENNVSDDIELGNSVSDSNQCENTTLFLENEACSGTLTDKSVVNKKRKLSTTSEDSVINKVPKYNSSETSDSVNNVQESVESYCKVLSCNSDKQLPNDEDGGDILSPAVPGDNVILTLGKAVEESSVVNEKPKSR